MDRFNTKFVGLKCMQLFEVFIRVAIELSLSLSSGYSKRSCKARQTLSTLSDDNLRLSAKLKLDFHYNEYGECRKWSLVFWIHLSI